MKTMKLLLYSVLIGVLFFSACKKDEEEEPAVNESQVLVEYLENADYVNTYMPSIMPASEVKTLMATNEVYIIDIRSATDFAAGHIENAVNVPVGDILNHVKGINLDAYTKVAVVCYTGQTAGWAVSLLRIMGYDKVFSMKWGMSSWNEVFDRWTPNTGNAYATQFTGTPTDKGPMGDLPNLNTGQTEGMQILEARVNAVLAEGFDPAKINNATLFGSLNNYYIVNYWPLGQYQDPGHIPGAIQYTPKETIKLATDLKTLPTDKPVVIYCYTGQTSAFLAAYLRVVGYDAKSLLFGANGMIYDVMAEAGMTTFKPSEIKGYEYVDGK